MVIYLGILLFSLSIFLVSIVPFIDLLYKFKFTYRKFAPPNNSLETTVYQGLLRQQNFKLGTPVGGGVLIIVLVSLLFPLIFNTLSHFGLFVHSSYPIREELNVIFFTFISFGLLGLFNDLVGYWPNRIYFKIALSLFCGLLLYTNLGISSLNLPFLGNWSLGPFYPLLAGLIIFIFVRAYNITDGLDGLAGGNLTICLFAFWALSQSVFDTPISIFISLWLAGLLVFLYFNIFPARIWLGNSGALSFGATLAVLGLLLGKGVSLLVIGGVFLIEFLSWVFQVISVKFLHRKLFIISPLHNFFLARGWPEPKIVMRSWIIGVLLSFVGLWLS